MIERDDIVIIGSKKYLLDGWNGEVYVNCREIDTVSFGYDGYGYATFKSNEEYTIRPVYAYEVKKVQENDEDFEIVDYKLEY